MESLEWFAAVLGTLDLVLAVELARRRAGGDLGRLVSYLRHPPVPAALGAYGDAVELVFYAWLLVVSTSWMFPGEEFLAGLSLGSTVAFTSLSVVYLGLLLKTAPGDRR